MPAAVVDLPEPLMDLPLAGRTARRHWDEVLASAGLTRVQSIADAGDGGLVAVDGRFAGVPPERLRELALLLSAVGGMLCTAKGEVVAVAHLPGALEDDHPLLVPSGGHVLELNGVDVIGGDAGASIESEWGRALAERAIVGRRLERLAAVGVRLVTPHTIHVDATVRVAPGATLYGGCTLLGQTRIERGVVVHAGAWLRDATVGEGTVIKPGSVLDGAVVGTSNAVGPMAHLRPGAVLEGDVKVGNFVEIKNATLREGVRASHLTYLGDAEIGERTNVGAGTITCNYDGVAKHITSIGADTFIGSNTALVAPIRIGSGVIIGAGSTLSRDVPDRALAVERGERKVIDGKAPAIWARNRERAKKRDG